MLPQADCGCSSLSSWASAGAAVSSAADDLFSDLGSHLGGSGRAVAGLRR
jgi:hypothetical protein